MTQVMYSQSSSASDLHSNYGKDIISFSTVDIEEPKRGRTWFVGLAVFIVLGVFYGIVTNSLSFVLLCMLLVSAYMLTHSRKPQEIEVHITDTGVRWGDQFFFYPQIDFFWVFWVPGELQTLNLKVKEGFVKEITIPIKGQNVSQIRETLSFYVPEIEGRRESISNFLIRKLKL